MTINSSTNTNIVLEKQKLVFSGCSLHKCVIYITKLYAVTAFNHLKLIKLLLIEIYEVIRVAVTVYRGSGLRLVLLAVVGPAAVEGLLQVGQHLDSQPVVNHVGASLAVRQAQLGRALRGTTEGHGSGGASEEAHGFSGDGFPSDPPGAPPEPEGPASRPTAAGRTPPGRWRGRGCGSLRWKSSGSAAPTRCNSRTHRPCWRPGESSGPSHTFRQTQQEEEEVMLHASGSHRSKQGSCWTCEEENIHTVVWCLILE